MSNNNFLVIIFLALIVGVGVFYIKSQTSQNLDRTLNTVSNSMPVIDESTNPSSVDEMIAINNNAVNFNVEGGSFYFKPNEIKVKLGQTVKIEFTSKSGLHDFVLDEFNIKTKVLSSGKSEIVEFTADKLGQFEFYCSVPGHRQSGMIGKLIVEE